MRRLLSIFALALVCSAYASPEPTNSIKQKFEQLHAEWVKQCDAPAVSISSNPQTYTALPAFRSIVAMGRPALPYLKWQMENDRGLDFMLAYAVIEICGWKSSDFHTYDLQKFRDMVLERMKREGHT